jgi:hypothetical protein
MIVPRRDRDFTRRLRCGAAPEIAPNPTVKQWQHQLSRQSSSRPRLSDTTNPNGIGFGALFVFLSWGGDLRFNFLIDERSSTLHKFVIAVVVSAVTGGFNGVVYVFWWRKRPQSILFIA